MFVLGCVCAVFLSELVLILLLSVCFSLFCPFYYLFPLFLPLPLSCLPIPLASISPLGTSARFSLSTTVSLLPNVEFELPSLMYQMCLVSIKDAEVPEPSLLYFALFCLFVWIAAAAVYSLLLLLFGGISFVSISNNIAELCVGKRTVNTDWKRIEQDWMSLH